MGLMGTLAKVAVGIAVAKGAEKMMSGNKAATGDGGLFGAQHSPNARSGSTGLEDIMGDVLGGRAQTGGAQSGGGIGGLGGLLEGLQQQNPNTRDGGIDDLLGGGGSGGGMGGGLGSLLESLAGGQAGGSSGAGGLGGLLGGLMGAAGGQAGGGGGFGDLLNQAMQQRGDPPQQPSQNQEAVAGLMLRAMIQAAKSDGKFDAAEQQKLMERLGDVSAEERDFVNRELQSPVDIHGLAHQTPQGLERQVYTMSVLGIDLDNQNEAKYLHELASEFRLDKATVNAIHAQMGAPAIYRA